MWILDVTLFFVQSGRQSHAHRFVTIAGEAHVNAIPNGGGRSDQGGAQGKLLPDGCFCHGPSGAGDGAQPTFGT